MIEIEQDELDISAILDDSFSGIVGQELAVQKIKLAIESASLGDDLTNFLKTAPAGNGKTALARAMQKAYSAMGYETLWFDSAEDFRVKGEQYDSLIQAIMEPDLIGEKGVVVFIDEAHKFRHKATVQLDKVYRFIMAFADGNNKGKTVRLGDDMTAVVNRKKLAFVLMTNFPSVLDKSGAFQSRFEQIKLDLYSKDELVQILQIQLEKNKLKPANEKTLSLIANTGRGTARPMEKIVEQLRNLATVQGKNTINRDDALQAMRLARVYPNGASVEEIRLLGLAKQPMADKTLLSILNMESQTFNASKAFLLGIGYACHARGGIVVTDKGSRYLSDITKDGFKTDF